MHNSDAKWQHQTANSGLHTEWGHRVCLCQHWYNSQIY